MPTKDDFNLRGRLKQLGMTQVAFADLVKVNGTTVRTWVRKGTPGLARRLVELIEYETGNAPMPDWCIKLVVPSEEEAAVRFN